MASADAAPALAPLSPRSTEIYRQMRREMTASMNTALQGMQQQHTAEVLALAQAHAARPAAAAVPRNGARAPEMAKYNGTTPSLDAWFSALLQQCEFYGLASDADRIRIAAVYLVGPALDWWQHCTRATTWVDFQAGLRLRFQPVTSEETARSKLLVISQGRSSINEYVSAFSSLLAAVPGVDTAMQLHLFLRGLNESTRNVIRSQPSVPTLEQALVMAVRIATPMQSASSSSSSAAPSSAMDLSMMEIEDGPGAMERRIVEHVLAAMDVRAAYGSGRGRGEGAGSHRGAQGADGSNHGPRGLPVIKGLTPEQVQMYMDKGLCFGCKSAEHGSRHCPLRRVVNGRAVWKK